MKKSISLFLLIALVSVIHFSFQTKKVKEEINWMTWAEVQEAQKENPKKVFVDIYTHWCGWCKRMDATTFNNAKVVSYINENYYAVKFNAENRETIIFKGDKFKYVKSGRSGFNELATSLLEGKMSFPSTVYLDENLDILTTVGGYLEPETIDPILSFFAKDFHLKMKWSKYEKSFKSFL